MKKFFILFFLLVLYTVTNAQYSLRIIVTDVATKKQDDIYVAGSFNNWNAGDVLYRLKPFGPGRKLIVLKNLPAGKVEFKLTRGSWHNVETNSKGEDINNRTIELNEDATMNIHVEGWKDDFPDKPKPNTATANVKILANDFEMPQLGRKRRIWLYLPASYNSLKSKSYPVLYMHDGQNLFNEQTAPFGEWGVDEALDSLQKITGKECIVVGIDNGEDKRLNEYNPFDHNEYGKGEGKLYAQFIVETLKPYIDKHYRTLTDVNNTFVAGSSMGGLISLFLVMEYPHVFKSAGIFSPAFWVSPQIFDLAKSFKPKQMKHFYFYAGGKENKTMVKDMEKMIKILQQGKNYDIISSVDPMAEHKESAWRKEFPAFYRWLMK